MKRIFNLIISILIFFTIGILIPYLIQFQFNFFGADIILFKDIIRLWCTSIIFGLIFSIIYCTS